MVRCCGLIYEVEWIYKNCGEEKDRAAEPWISKERTSVYCVEEFLNPGNNFDEALVGT